VATDLAEIRRFNSDHGDIVKVAATADAYAAAVRDSLPPAPAPEVERRIAVAASNSWERRLEAMTRLIDEAVGRRDTSSRGWEDRLRRLYRVTRTRTAEIVAALAVIYLLVFQTPLVWWMASPLQVSEAPRAADAIVVFAGGVGESGRAGGGFQERVTQAIALYRAGHAQRMIFSSGFVFTLREAEVMKAIAVDNGVPERDIFLEESAANTRENVVHTKAILDAHGWRRILLVSSPYHMRRAMLTFEKLAPGIEVIATPVPESQFYAHTRGASLEQIRGLLHEAAAIVQYWWRGWL